ncbi:MAG: cell wall metabolism sensor histidine kinase WalK [Chloroflexi bacterium]|nr:cell wall metabolism sensor histidine kinase WalK [Chloroflexota bacterium]
MQESRGKGHRLSRMQFGIRERLTLSYLVIIVIAMGLSGFLLLSLLNRYFLQAMQNSLLAQAKITAQALMPGALAGTAAQATVSSASNTLQQQANNYSLQTLNVAPAKETSSTVGAELGYLANSSLQLSTQLDTRIRILDVTGKVVVDSMQDSQGVSMADDPLVAAALAGTQSSSVEGAGSAAAMDLALPWQADGRLIGVIYLSQPLRDMTAVLYDLRLRWLLATLLALVLTVGAGVLLSGAITRPLYRLTEAAGTVAEGNLDQRVPVQSHDELGRLSTAFNEMTERLRASRQAQANLVADVSHELRTPLTTVKGMVETLRDGAVEDLEVRDRFLASIEGETDRMIRLVNGLLLLSRADASALDLHLNSLALAPVIARVFERLRPLAEKKHVTLHLDAQAGVPPVLADEDRVELILVNLLDNAIKYSRPGGNISVALRQNPKNMAQIEVKDEGVGMSAEALSRAGERFFRADQARSRDEGGSGLGLAIACTLVEAHGGQLTLQSQEGKGLTVTCTFPFA